jgi:hypothetical protein
VSVKNENYKKKAKKGFSAISWREQVNFQRDNDEIRFDISGLLLKVALNTINHQPLCTRSTRLVVFL